jgi:hypothetical protein
VIEQWIQFGSEEEQTRRKGQLDQLLPLVRWQNVAEENVDKFKALFGLEKIPTSIAGTLILNYELHKQ